MHRGMFIFSDFEVGGIFLVFIIVLVTRTTNMGFGPLTGGLAMYGADAEKGGWVGGEWWAAGPHRLGFGSCSIWRRLHITASISH